MRESKELKFEKICPLDIKFDDKAAYFSILDCPDGKIRLYYRSEGHWGPTHVRESDDGISFSEPKSIWKEDSICHNFSPFIYKGTYYAVGGEDHCYPLKTTHVHHAHKKGLYLLNSHDGINWKLVKDDPIITPEHPGFIKAPFSRLSEFDGFISCVHYKDKFYLYFRANVARQIRTVQYATSDNLIDWSEVKPVRFCPEFNAAGGHNLYSPYFFNFEDRIMGFIPFYINIGHIFRKLVGVCKGRIFRKWFDSDFVPFFMNKGHGFIGVYEPEAMDRWTLTGYLNKGTLSPLPIAKNRSFPVKGVIRSRENPEILYYYVHENYFKAEKNKPVMINLYMYKNEK